MLAAICIYSISEYSFSSRINSSTTIHQFGSFIKSSHEIVYILGFDAGECERERLSEIPKAFLHTFEH